jgi:hypothetical protein
VYSALGDSSGILRKQTNCKTTPILLILRKAARAHYKK